MTEGRRLLLAVLRRTKVTLMARRCRVTPGAVYHWTAGRNGPGPRSRRLLRLSYEIPATSWKSKVAE